MMFPEELKDRAERAARAKGVSFGALVRESLELYLAEKKKADPFFSDTRVFTGRTPPDLSAEHDKYLYDE